jgi:hypothetical protein
LAILDPIGAILKSRSIFQTWTIGDSGSVFEAGAIGDGGSILQPRTIAKHVACCWSIGHGPFDAASLEEVGGGATAGYATGADTVAQTSLGGMGHIQEVIELTSGWTIPNSAFATKVARSPDAVPTEVGATYSVSPKVPSPDAVATEVAAASIESSAPIEAAARHAAIKATAPHGRRETSTPHTVAAEAASHAASSHASTTSSTAKAAAATAASICGLR